MTARLVRLVCGILLIGAFGVALTFQLPVQSTAPQIRITLPAPDLDPKLAALSGIWEAAQESLASTRVVVVEQITDTRADLLLIGPTRGGWQRVRGRVSPAGSIEWGFPVIFTLRLLGDGSTLESQVRRVEPLARTTLAKVGTFVSLREPTVQAALIQAVQVPGAETTH